MATSKHCQFGKTELLLALAFIAPSVIGVHKIFHGLNPLLPFPWVLMEQFVAPVIYVLFLSWFVLTRSSVKSNGGKPPSVAKSLGVGAIFGLSYLVMNFAPFVVFLALYCGVSAFGFGLQVLVVAVRLVLIFSLTGSLAGLVVGNVMARTRTPLLSGVLLFALCTLGCAPSDSQLERAETKNANQIINEVDKQSSEIRVQQDEDLGFRHGRWEATSISLLRHGQEAIKIDAKKTTYQYGEEGLNARVVVSFLLPESKRLWIGPEQDFYVQFDTNVMGVQLTRGDMNKVFWRKSMHPNPNAEFNGSIEEAINSFDSKIDNAKLGRAVLSDDVDLDKNLTYLPDRISDNSFFMAAPGASNVGEMKLAGFGMDGNDVRFDIENLTTGNNASVWIEFESKKITKVKENDEQTFPNIQEK